MDDDTVYKIWTVSNVVLIIALLYFGAATLEFTKQLTFAERIDRVLYSRYTYCPVFCGINYTDRVGETDTIGPETLVNFSLIDPGLSEWVLCQKGYYENESEYSRCQALTRSFQFK